MVRTVKVKGRVVGPRTVELDEPVTNVEGVVEVVLRQREPADADGESLAAYLERLPRGHRTKSDIDGQLRDERNARGESVSRSSPLR